MKKFASLIFGLLLVPTVALAQYGPPNPWVVNGASISYSSGGVLVGATVTGGSKGAGTINASGLYVNGNNNLNLLAAGTYPGAASIITLGTVTDGTWNAGVISSTYGGTSVNNAGRTITVGGNLQTTAALTIAGNQAATFTMTGPTSVVFPLSGTLATTTSPSASIGVGSTAVTGGTTTRILYDAAGLLGEYTLTGSGTVVAMQNAPTFIAPILGTPASGVATNLTGTAAGLTAGNVTTNANLTGPITSVGNATSIASQTGTGNTFVMSAGPTVTGSFTATGLVTLADHATQATNTVIGNATSGSASPTALSIGSCSTASSALVWTTNTGFGCNTSITANAVPAANLTGSTLASGVTASSLTSLGTLTGLAVGGGVTVTSSSAAALTVGLNGATNPALKVDASTASQAAGLSITGAATGGTVALAAIDSGSNTNLTINAKGSGTIGIGSVSTGAVTITPSLTIASITGSTQCVHVNSSGVLSGVGSDCGAASSLTVGTTTVGGGTSGYVLYNNAGTLGNLATTGSGNVVRATGATMTLSSATGCAISTCVSGLATTVPAALGIDINVAGGFAGYSTGLLPNLQYLPAITNANSTSIMCYYQPSGVLTYSNAAGCVASLEELKNDHGPITPEEAHRDVQALRPFWGVFKNGNTNPKGVDMPFLGARQAAKVDPRLGGYDDKGKLYSIMYAQMAAVFVANEQYVQKEIDGANSREYGLWLAVLLLALWNIWLTIRVRKK